MRMGVGRAWLWLAALCGTAVLGGCKTRGLDSFVQDAEEQPDLPDQVPQTTPWEPTSPGTQPSVQPISNLAAGLTPMLGPAGTNMIATLLSTINQKLAGGALSGQAGLTPPEPEATLTPEPTGVAQADGGTE